MLTLEEFVQIFGEDEVLQIAGLGPREFREPDRPRIEEALAHASALVAGYVRDRWPAAVSGTPLLKGFVADIARWRLRGRGGPQSAMNETVQKRYDEALGRLKDISVGKMAPDLPEPEASTAQAQAAGDEFAVSARQPASRARKILEGFAV